MTAPRTESPIARLVSRAVGSAVGWGFSANLLRVGGALAVLPLMLARMSDEHVAFWYLFQSLTVLVGVLGSTFRDSTVRAVGYLSAGARSLLPFGLENAEGETGTSVDPVLYGRLFSTQRLFSMGVAAFALCLVGLIGFGVIAFRIHDDSMRFVAGCWGGLMLGISLRSAMGYWEQFLVGLDRVRDAQMIQFIGLGLNYAVAFPGLLLDHGLSALVAGNFVMCASMGLLYRIHYLRAARCLGLRPGREQASFDVLRTLWPNSWRQLATNGGVYLISEIPLIVSGILLPMSVTAAYAVTRHAVRLAQQIAVVWVLVKIPRMHMLRTEGNLPSLRALAVRRMLLVNATYVLLLIAAVIAAPVFLQFVRSATVLLSPGLFVLLGVVTLLGTNSGMLNQIILTENENPFWRAWIAAGLASFALAACLVKPLDILGVILAPALAQLPYLYVAVFRRAMRSVGGFRADTTCRNVNR